mgnify:CR=1 FL=1
MKNGQNFFEQYADLTICEDGCQIEETIDAVLTQIEALEKNDFTN